MLLTKSTRKPDIYRECITSKTPTRSIEPTPLQSSTSVPLPPLNPQNPTGSGLSTRWKEGFLSEKVTHSLSIHGVPEDKLISQRLRKDGVADQFPSAMEEKDLNETAIHRTQKSCTSAPLVL